MSKQVTLLFFCILSNAVTQVAASEAPGAGAGAGATPGSLTRQTTYTDQVKEGKDLLDRLIKTAKSQVPLSPSLRSHIKFLEKAQQKYNVATQDIFINLDLDIHKKIEDDEQSLFCCLVHDYDAEAKEFKTFIKNLQSVHENVVSVLHSIMPASTHHDAESSKLEQLNESLAYLTSRQESISSAEKKQILWVDHAIRAYEAMIGILSSPWRNKAYVDWLVRVLKYKIEYYETTFKCVTKDLNANRQEACKIPLVKEMVTEIQNNIITGKQEAQLISELHAMLTSTYSILTNNAIRLVPLAAQESFLTELKKCSELLETTSFLAVPAPHAGAGAGVTPGSLTR